MTPLHLLDQIGILFHHTMVQLIICNLIFRGSLSPAPAIATPPVPCVELEVITIDNDEPIFIDASPAAIPPDEPDHPPGNLLPALADIDVARHDTVTSLRQSKRI